MFSLKDRTTSREMISYVETLPDYFMITKWWDTLDNLKPITPYINITGGPDYVHTSKIKCADAGLANNLKSIDLCLDPLIFKGAQSTRPFANCSMDFITDLPPVDGFDSILVVVDQGLTKGVILTPCKKTITTKETG